MAGSKTPAETAFPVDSFKDAARELRRPFTPAAVKFKPQSILGTNKGVLCVAYIDARLVYERLNLIVPHLWSDHYRATSERQMWCDLTIDGITRSDVGEGTGKALVSDALKRAAVHFGIGVSLYAIPQQRIWADTQGGKLVKLWEKQGKWNASIEEPGQAFLRGVYEHWLTNHGKQAFGEPLDHGDVDDSQGDADEPVATPPAEPVQKAAPKKKAAAKPKPSAAKLPAEKHQHLLDLCREIRNAEIWTGRDLHETLLAAGATDADTVTNILWTLDGEQADSLAEILAEAIDSAKATA